MYIVEDLKFLNQVFLAALSTFVRFVIDFNFTRGDLFPLEDWDRELRQQFRIRKYIIRRLDRSFGGPKSFFLTSPGIFIKDFRSVVLDGKIRDIWILFNKLKELQKEHIANVLKGDQKTIGEALHLSSVILVLINLELQISFMKRILQTKRWP